MRATGWSSSQGTFGIRVGKRNRDQYFNPSWNFIEVEIDGSLHIFKLTSGFWRNCPEFRDSGTTVIKGWLDKNFEMPWPKGKPPAVKLDHILANRFRLVQKNSA